MEDRRRLSLRNADGRWTARWPFALRQAQQSPSRALCVPSRLPRQLKLFLAVALANGTFLGQIPKKSLAIARSFDHLFLKYHVTHVQRAHRHVSCCI
jgi:hypothetical protein